MSTFNTSRFFSAPPDVVFAALSSPERLAPWGPEGFTNTFETFEFKEHVALRHLVEPANEQNLNRWQAEVASIGRGR